MQASSLHCFKEAFLRTCAYRQRLSLRTAAFPSRGSEPECISSRPSPWKVTHISLSEGYRS